jgi:ABC-type sugar transport system permease subunit
MASRFFANRLAGQGRLGDLYTTLQRNRLAYILTIPLLIFMVFLLWLPFFRTILMSFFDWPVVGEVSWVGLENYEFVSEWDVFYTSLRATLIFSVTTVIQLAVALVAALAVNQLRKGQSLVSGLMLLPYTIPPVASGTIWVFLLNPEFGPVFGYLVDWGILPETIYWSTSGDLSLLVITLVASWSFWPFMFLIIYASLSKIPDEHYECARVFGASRLQMLRNITLPQLKSAIIVAIAIRTVWNLAKVSQPLQMTNGGPGFDTSFLGVLLYRFITRGDLGRSAVIGLVLFAVTLLFVLVFIRNFNPEETA